MERILINGEWVDAVSTACCEIKNPATLAPLGTVPDCGIEDVRRAVAAAKAAQQGWRKIPGAEKGKLLREIGERIRARGDALATLMTLETGTPLCESLDCVGWTGACFEYHGEAARAGHDNSPSPRASRLAVHGNEPVGVVAAITSFNSPLLAMARTVAPAIAAGNTMVCKPPHQNPLANLKLAEIYELLPPGVVNVITGGTDTGMALVEHAGVDLVAFTGSKSLGHQIAAAAGVRLKKLDLELGSPDPIIVLADAPLDLAVPGVAWARLRHSGQDCTSSKRIYVEESLAAEFADRIHEYIAYLEVGDPMRLETDLGPLISLEAARRVEEQVAHAAKEGARLKLGGRCFRPWGLPGHFFQPTILTDARHGSVSSREQILGPVLLITPAADAEQALRFANTFGCSLGGSIYTGTPALARQAKESFKAGRLEHIIARKSWWFPYRDRKHPRENSHDQREYDAGA